jgi:hypothetical protein
MMKIGNLVIGVCLGFGILLLSGCGERSESTSYYYKPDWTADGKIILVKGLQSIRKDAIGTQLGSTYTESLVTMTSAGASETFIFDVTDTPPWAPSCSPNRNYLAYMDDKRGDYYGKIVVRNVSTEAYTGMNEVVLLFSTNRIKSFDWSSDGNKIVYCTSQEVRIRDWNDYLGATDVRVTAEADLQFVSWKYGDRIAFVHGSPAVLSLIYLDGTRSDLSAAASVNLPQISSANTFEVYGIAGGSYCVVDTSAGTPATAEVYANFKGALPRISAAADKVVYDKVGEESGIYILDLSVTPKVENKIK